MGTSANVYIKTKDKNLKYNFSMDGGFSTLGINMLSDLNYKIDNFLEEFEEENQYDFDDKYQNYVYYIDLDKPSMKVFEVDKGEPIDISKEAFEFLKNQRRDLLHLIEI